MRLTAAELRGLGFSRMRIWYVYRMFAEDRLLYIGHCANMRERYWAHKNKPWFSDVTRITIEQRYSKDDARSAETHAIKTEAPVHNIIHNKGTRHD